MPQITEEVKQHCTAIMKREYLKLYGHKLKSKKLEEKVDQEIQKAIHEYETL